MAKPIHRRRYGAKTVIQAVPYSKAIYKSIRNDNLNEFLQSFDNKASNNPFRAGVGLSMTSGPRPVT